MGGLRLYFGSDHAAIELREHLAAHAREGGHEVVATLGPQASTDKADYPDVAVELSERVRGDAGAFGVLVCGTGQGMAITANRISGIRAVVCSDTFSADMGRAHNDANVLCVGARVVGLGLATAIFEAFVRGTFEGGRHQRRVDKITALDA
ncbi:MAG: ribose 5-phosphate isomerase B [Nannocystales bacterium]